MLSDSRRRGLSQKCDAVPETGTAVRWYAVQCVSRREVLAAAHLTRQQFEIFFPRRTKLRRHARRTETVLSPLFPGYLFVLIDRSCHGWRRVNGTRGVVSLVMQADLPLPVPRGVVESLKAACDQDGVMDWRAILTPGESVCVLSGPFAGLIGQLERLDGASRVRVLLDILGGRIPAVLPRESVVSSAAVM